MNSDEFRQHTESTVLELVGTGGTGVKLESALSGTGPGDTGWPRYHAADRDLCHCRDQRVGERESAPTAYLNTLSLYCAMKYSVFSLGEKHGDGTTDQYRNQ